MSDAPGAAAVRVLVVDDQELIRTGLRGRLRERFGFQIVGELASGAGIVEAVQALVGTATGLGGITGLIHAAGVSPTQASPATILRPAGH